MQTEQIILDMQDPQVDLQVVFQELFLEKKEKILQKFMRMESDP